MLSHLVIRNFAIIEHLEIPFEEGYTVFTGETGAGKSIIIDALNLILGGRASTDVIRTDEDEAAVEGIFEPNGARLERINEKLEAQGIEPSDQLVVRRRVRHSGRNKVFINGSLSTVTALREITRGLVDISGQHEHYSLLDADGHIDLVDSIGELGDERRQMSEAYGEVKELRDRLEQLRTDVQERLNRIDFLEYQLQEIDEAGLTEGEEEELDEEFNRLKYAEKIGDSAQKALQLTYEGNQSAAEQLSIAVKELRGAAQHDAELQELVDELEEARIETEETAMALQDYLSDIEVNPARLDKVVERIDLIQRLKRKHGVESVEALLQKADEMRQEVDTLQNAEQRTKELETKLEAAERQAFQVARDLSQKRREAAATLRERIEAELADLNMEDTRFLVDIQPPEMPPEDVDLASEDDRDERSLTLSETGFDDVEFLIAPNVGEEPRPLAKIASGGELSRIMLAIKSVLMERDSVETYIFDEVDAGIGGKTADVVGEKIARTAESHQIVCISHLPQIASRGDHHYHVEKHQADGRTQSTVQRLGDDERIGEVARMIGGEVSTKTRDAAREMLER
jgi:DNA repair protein RecN (Recombination protein N)